MSLKSPANSTGGGAGGVTSVAGGSGIAVSASTGAVTISGSAAVQAAALLATATSIAANSGGITLPSNYGTVLITGTATGSSTTCPCTMPASPVDQQLLLVMFNGTQVPTFTANSGQSFPAGAPNSQACNVGSFYLFFYDGSNKLGGGTYSWYVAEYLGADGNPYNASASYTAGSLGYAVQQLQSDVATITGTTNQITVAFVAGPPGTFTLSLPSAIVTPGTLVSTGFADNSNAAAGTVGEYVDSGVLATATSLSTGTPVNCPLTTYGLSGSGPAFVLTAGDWEVDGNIIFIGTGATITYLQGGFNTSSATLPASTTGYLSASGGSNFAAGTPGHTQFVQPRRFSSASAINVYLVAQAGFSAGSVTAQGFIRARRVR